MKIPFFLLIIPISAAAAEYGHDQEIAIERALEKPIACEKPKTFIPLFELSASGLITGAHTSEELSEANEDAFLKCPYQFLRSLMKLPKAKQEAVLNYFGIRHAPWDLGKELRNWQHDKIVGKFVKENFADYLTAEEPE